MPTIIRRTYVAVGEAELTPRKPDPPHRTGPATLVFYRAVTGMVQSWTEGDRYFARRK